MRPLVLALLGFVLAGCPEDIGFTPPDEPGGSDGDADGDSSPVEDPYWCCDPDEGQCVCPGYWRCTDGIEGKVCRQSNPPMPDDGGDTPWTCEYSGEFIVCEGQADDHPDAGSEGGWTCERDGAGGIVCRREADEDDYPDEGDVGQWDCTFATGSQARACEEDSGGGPDDGTWDCSTSADGQTVCENDNPDQPDDGEWQCFRREDGADVCQGDHMPDSGDSQGWDCTQEELVTCENANGDHPDSPGQGGWDCAWDAAGLRCHDNPGGGGDVGGEGEGEGEGEGGDGGGDLPGGEGEGENPDDGGGGVGDDCECIAGAARYCDEPDYCLWGTQTCQNWFGIRTWGPCVETNIPADCAPGGALADDYAWHFAGGYWDSPGTRAYDLDGDGILVYPPDFWFNPAGEDCAIRAGGCAQDMWDLDADGDNQESMGDCADIQECV